MGCTTLDRLVRISALLGLLTVAGPLLAEQTCPITRPPAQAFTPPQPYPQQSPAGFFYLGSDNLWTAVRNERWTAVATDQGFRIKIPWFVANLTPEELQHPRIAIRARRMDQPSAAAIKVEGPGNASLPQYSFFASVLVFPSTGCWEITAARLNTELRFTVLVD